MGMAASQARLLSMTARLSNNEFEQQSIAYSKQRLAENSERINDAYLDALNKTKYQVLTGYNGTEACYADLTFNQLTGPGSVALGKQYLVKDNKGKVLVSQKIAEAFKKNNGDLNKFLRDLGYTQANIDISKYSTSENAIHEAWDRYLNSVGLSIDNANGQHVLGFGYASFENEAFGGYPTYNTAYAANNELGVSLSLLKDSSGYYTNRQTVEARQYPDAEGNLITGVFYQTAAQEGTDNYTQLLDVSYNVATGKYTYTNIDKEEVETDVLYASEGPDGSAVLSEDPKNYLTLVNAEKNQYKSESGVTYTVTEAIKALNFEGTTQAQRELYDYATAITEAYYNSAADHSNTEYDAGMVNYYKNIFNEMRTCGYTTIEDETKFKENDWFVKQLKAGALTLSYFSAVDKSFVGTTLYDDESITEKEDKAAIAIAEQEYNAAMDKIENQDKQFDLQLNKLEAEHNSLQTEYDAVKGIISKNIEKSYNIFNA
ncbi:hypothetical protein HDR58_01180 [bacterium]|nr:hypothetical protein [bacterium]